MLRWLPAHEPLLLQCHGKIPSPGPSAHLRMCCWSSLRCHFHAPAVLHVLWHRTIGQTVLEGVALDALKHFDDQSSRDASGHDVLDGEVFIKRVNEHRVGLLIRKT